MVKSKLSLHSGSVALRQLSSIKRGHKVFFFFYKCSPSNLVYYHGENKVMKHRIFHFTETFENNMVNVFINEDVVNFDSFDKNGGFIKKE